MEIVLIIVAVAVGAFLFSKGASSLVAPAPATGAAQAASVPTLSLAALQQEIVALTPKSVDPLAPKPVAVVAPNILHAITPALTAKQALDEAKLNDFKLNPAQFAATAWLDRVYHEIENMHTLAWVYQTNTYVYNDSGTSSAPPLQLVGQGSNMALSVTGNIAAKVGSSVTSAIPFIGTAVNGIIGIFGAIAAHHKAAVGRDLAAYDGGNSAAENYMAIIKSAVASGQATPQEAIHALDSMYADFLTFTAPARNNSPWCNSVCEAKVVLNATVIYWKAYYTQIIASGVRV